MGERLVSMRPNRGIRPGYSRFELELKRAYKPRIPPVEEIPEEKPKEEIKTGD